MCFRTTASALSGFAEKKSSGGGAAGSTHKMPSILSARVRVDPTGRTRPVRHMLHHRLAAVGWPCRGRAGSVPRVYYPGWNNGWNVAEAINYSDGTSAKRFRNNINCWPECPRDGAEALRIRWRDKLAAPPCPAIPGWSAPKQTQALKLGRHGYPLDIERTLASRRKTVDEV